MQTKPFERYLLTLRLIFSSILCASVAFFVYNSIHWQVMCDTSIMHYINFLMAHGMAPYRDIIDINMPGSYFIEGWAMHLFGGGDLGWRLYEFFLLAILTAALIVISLPYDWFAGLFAGVFFLLIHGLEGPINAAQRDEVMTVLIMVGYALLFTSMRRHKPRLLLPFGFVIGLAASLKPTAAPLGLLLLLIMTIALKRKKIALKPYLMYALLGLAVAFLIDLQFLFQYHAFGAFVATARRLIPYYAHVGNRSALFLLAYLLVGVLLPRRMFVLLIMGLILTLANRKRRECENWEWMALGLGILFGAFSFMAQGKAFAYHAYPFKVFVFLWLALEGARAMKTSGLRHVIGLVFIGFGVCVVVPNYAFRTARIDPLNDQPDAIKADLIRLGGSSLQHQVQCLDMVDGCFGALYRLHLLPNTGFIGDYMFFGPIGSPPQPYYRNMLWNDLHKNPPKVIVLTNQWLCEPESFQKIDQWPELAAYLHAAYTLDITKTFGKHGYKIFLLKNGGRPPDPPLTPNARAPNASAKFSAQ